MFVCFFFQAEDGIRDIGVTGVQTCALPISRVFMTVSYRMPDPDLTLRVAAGDDAWEAYGFDHFNMLNAWDQPTQEYKTRDCLIRTQPGERRPEHCRTSIVGES